MPRTRRCSYAIFITFKCRTICIVPLKAICVFQVCTPSTTNKEQCLAGCKCALVLCGSQPTWRQPRLKYVSVEGHSLNPAFCINNTFNTIAITADGCLPQTVRQGQHLISSVCLLKHDAIDPLRTIGINNGQSLLGHLYEFFPSQTIVGICFGNCDTSFS